MLSSCDSFGSRSGSNSSAVRAGRVHLVGAAGAGMRSLSRLLVEAGWEVTGSDLTDVAGSQRVVHGHRAELVTRDLDLVVHSAAVDEKNVERARARQLGLPDLSCPEMLGWLMQGRLGLTIAGTHGKSTTSAMLVEILRAAGLDPSFAIGAAWLGDEGSGGHLGADPLFVVEACEYRRHFLNLTPSFAAITGIELDHFDCFKHAGDLERAFAEFAARMPDSGVLVRRDDCAATARATAAMAARVATYGWTCDADWRGEALDVDRGRYRLNITCAGHPPVEVRLRAPGRHNAENALAAAAVAGEFGVPTEAIVAGLSGFAGLARRLERLGEFDGVLYLDDYAHHPTAVRETLRAIREMCPARRVWCVFQPHQASRTRHLLDELAASLQNADIVAVADVFAAREPAGEELRELATELAARTSRGGSTVLPCHDATEIVECLAEEMRPGDVVATLGAGDIRKVHDGLLERVRGIRAAA